MSAYSCSYAAVSEKVYRQPVAYILRTSAATAALGSLGVIGTLPDLGMGKLSSCSGVFTTMGPPHIS